MKLTNNAKELIDFYKKNGLQFNQELNNSVTEILKNFYDEFTDAFAYVRNIKRKDFNLTINKLTSVNQIPKPLSVAHNFITTEVKNAISDQLVSSYTYTMTSFLERKLTITFVTNLDDPHNSKNITKYNKYFKNMLVWLYIINEYALELCSNTLKILIYHIDLPKELPKSKNDVIGKLHANTAYSTPCPINAEIVIYRFEEWFRAFIHETIHSFGLEFSIIDHSICSKYILTKFYANSNVDLYEAYTEFWAKNINVMFCSFVSSTSFDVFKNNFKSLITLEIIHSCFQMIKVLNHMRLNYVSLISEETSKQIYKEEANVLSYYVITFVLMYFYQDFLLWCETNNSEIMSFKMTQKNIHSFCNFIGNKYNNQELLQFVSLVQNKFVLSLKKNESSPIFTNLRMTLCELH